ncbi:hypothetical protein MKZ38_006046 [Zalerion maritima]|uniref:DUF7702 domain-containing protein n=1 Tax=Zalerion maritima TaxID=339359 RepID=A0AAD5WQJ7_9PEZI|nr:hypothetical protein MKZ38_006046 [Zalerion maritima]
MVDQHTTTAIAQIVFYVPMVPITSYMCYRNWKYGPRMAWYPEIPFSLLRLIGGVLTLFHERDKNNRLLIIVTIVFLNVGLVPLIMSFLGIFRLIKKFHIFASVVRYNIFVAIGLLTVSGALAATPDLAQVQAVLSKIADLQFACVLAALISACCLLYFKMKDEIGDSTMIYLQWILIASPPICVRTAYGLISVFEASGDNMTTSMWSPLFGSALAFSLLALVPEYITLCIYLFLAGHRLRTAKRCGLERRKTREHNSAQEHQNIDDGERSVEYVELR